MSERMDTLVEMASEAAWKNICATHAEPGPYLEWADVPEPAKRLVRDRQRAGLEAVLPLVAKVWVATIHYDHEGESVLGVATTAQKARGICEAHNAEDKCIPLTWQPDPDGERAAKRTSPGSAWYSDYYIVEWEVEQ